MIRPSTNKILEVRSGSPAERAGMHRGDRILSVNKKKVSDELDFAYLAHEDTLHVQIDREGKKIFLTMEKQQQEDPGVVLEPMKIATCGNNCIFCFVRQLPKGLRRSLYVKDEDYRMSFLYGNYVTLSNLTSHDRDRIIEQRLSPLYISIHTTNPDLRRLMLGNKKAQDIMKDIAFFTSRKIRFHAQIVLCPGYNDGEELDRTIRDLSSLYPYMLSVAVVPVGLTRHRKKQLAPVLREDALTAIELITKYQKRFLKKYGDPLVYAADELYIKAGLPFPPARNYGDFPQIENGVGMVPAFLHQSRFVKLSSYAVSKKRFVAITGTSFYPYLSPVIAKLKEKTSCHIDIIPVVNRFFGESVTVTGLLTGRDIIQALTDAAEHADIILIPDVVLRDSKDMMLDNVTVRDMETALNREVRVIEPTIPGMLRGMEDSHAA